MKSKKSIFALALCGVLAICASVIGATAAWFTDSVTVSGTVATATLDIDSSLTLNVTNAVPGQKILADGIVVTEGTNKVSTSFYLRITVDGSIPGLTVSAPDGFIGTGTKFYYGSGSALTALSKSDLPLTLWSDGLTIPETAGNEIQGQNGTLTIKIDVVQSTGVTATTAGFDAAFSA